MVLNFQYKYSPWEDNRPEQTVSGDFEQTGFLYVACTHAPGRWMLLYRGSLEMHK